MGMYNQTSKVIDSFLAASAVGGTLALTILAPNAAIALEKPLKRYLDNRASNQEAKRIARYLKQQRLVHVKPNEDGSFTVTFTEKGRSRAQKAYFERLTLPSQKWDQKWRIFMFDIPEKYKTTRDYISHHLKRIGFKQLQKSVFVFPFPVDEFVAVLNDLFPEVAKHVSYMTVSEIDNHNKLVKQFKNLL